MDGMQEESPTVEIIEEICAARNNSAAALIEILHDVQNSLGHVPPQAQAEIARLLNLSRAEVHAVASFYDDFTATAFDGTTLRICRGEACQALGAQDLIDKGRRACDRKKDRSVEIREVFCLGNCALGPAAMLKDRLLAHLDEAALERLIGGEEK